ncbi:CDP-glycerol--poly(Glycerophosphate) glycerophosphotransferase [Brochothrix thermosphacta]|uniref:CDP-glycerol glycerophosphotransferase family protein n=1 Tax=Brochothrix thermosphacta TaxID=2756 RepID=UPI000D7B61D5|nr:CDP-glycerol glycerophosphotransferase family protein [Brochothrix thermosphacta]SPP27740.1 CDP-glycerol--poly(Glycerophosphate) glycerophosphotransferase [Brochothrix thermosphacta]
MDEANIKDISIERTVLLVEIILLKEQVINAVFFENEKSEIIILNDRNWKQINQIIKIEFSLVNGPTGLKYFQSGSWEIGLLTLDENVIPVKNNKTYISEKTVFERKKELKIETNRVPEFRMYNSYDCLFMKNFYKTVNQYYAIALVSEKNTGKFLIVIVDKNNKINNKVNFKIIIPNIKHNIKNMLEHAVFFIIKKIIPLKKNRILFTSNSRELLSGNLKFIYEELVSRDIKEYWDVKVILKGTHSKKRTLVEKLIFPYFAATSKKIIIDDYNPEIMKFNYKKRQEIIQVWHATGAFKTVGFSRLGLPGGPKINDKTHRKYSAVIVNSEQDIPYYSEAFGVPENKVVVTGIPRNDVFFNDNYATKVLHKLKVYFPEIIGKDKVITFAPTFRGHGKKTAHYPYEYINVSEMGEFARETNSVILIKMHPFIKEKISIPEKYKEYIVDASKYREINDFLFITDILITDYSSVIYEYSLFEKQMIFYAFDYEEYSENRDFYLPYKKAVPGEIVYTFKDLMKILRSQHYDSEKISRFKHENYQFVDSYASRRVVTELIMKDTTDLA